MAAVVDDFETSCSRYGTEMYNNDVERCEVCGMDGLCSRCLHEHDCGME